MLTRPAFNLLDPRNRIGYVFASIEDMQNEVAINQGMVVEVLGNISIGDGYSAVYHVDVYDENTGIELPLHDGLRARKIRSHGKFKDQASFEQALSDNFPFEINDTIEVGNTLFQKTKDENQDISDWKKVGFDEVENSLSGLSDEISQVSTKVDDSVQKISDRIDNIDVTEQITPLKNRIESLETLVEILKQGILNGKPEISTDVTLIDGVADGTMREVEFSVSGGVEPYTIESSFGEVVNNTVVFGNLEDTIPVNFDAVLSVVDFIGQRDEITIEVRLTAKDEVDPVLEEGVFLSGVFEQGVFEETVTVTQDNVFEANIYDEGVYV